MQGRIAMRPYAAIERVAPVCAFLTVGLSSDHEPTVNSNCELTVATTAIRNSK